MPDRVISVPQATQIATKIKNKFDNVNERLNDLNSGFSKLGLSVEDGVLCVEFGEDEELEG